MSYQTTFKLTSTAVSVLVLSGCMSNRAMPNRVNDFSPVMPQTEISSKVVDGSIYSGGINDGLFGDRKAYRVGDLITILLREATAASKDADSTITRTSSTGIGLAGDRAQWLVKRYTSRTVRCTLDDP